MLTILYRTLLIYALLILIMRCMGKRQLGELEVTDLVTTLLISEVAALPITDEEIPLAHAVLPLVVLCTLEVLLATLAVKLPRVKRMFSARPAILIYNGKPRRATMRAMRISAEELLSQLRLKEVSDPAEVLYAILEPNGQISVIKKATAQPPTVADLGAEPTEHGIMHLIMVDGEVNRQGLRLAGKDDRWLAELLAARHLRPEEVFLLLCDDGGRVRVVEREEGRRP